MVGNTSDMMGRRGSVTIRKVLSGKIGMLFMLFILLTIFSVLADNFFSAINIQNILIQAASNAIIAVGMTIVIISGQIDLSVGAVMALSSVLGAKVMVSTGSISAGVAVALIAGVLCGLVNGLIIALLDFQPFITTLSTMWLFRGIAYVITNGQPVTNLPGNLMNLTAGKLLGLSYVVWIIIALYILCFFGLEKTTYGRRIYAIGDNQEASRISGINVKGTKILVLIIAGLMSAIAGIIVMSRVNSAQPVAGNSYEMYAIAAAVIGGASLTNGGVGDLIGSLIGALFIAALQNGLNIMNVTAFWQYIFMGIVVLFAMLIDKARKKD